MNLPTGSGSSSPPCCHPSGPPPAGRAGTIARFSTAFSGSWPRACPGAMCRSGTVRGPHCTAASGAGAWPGCGTGCSRRSKPKPTRRAGWIGPSTLSMALLSGHISMPPEQRGGPGDGGARAQPGRLLDQGPSPGGGRGQAADAAADAWPAARGHRLRAAAGAGRRPTAGPGPSPPAARPGGRRQRLHRAAVSSVLSTARHPLHNPPPTDRAAPRTVRPRRVPVAEPGGAPDQSLQAVPQPGDPVRQALRQLPHPLGARCHHPLASSLAFAYRA